MSQSPKVSNAVFDSAPVFPCPGCGNAATVLTSLTPLCGPLAPAVCPTLSISWRSPWHQHKHLLSEHISDTRQELGPDKGVVRCIIYKIKSPQHKVGNKERIQDSAFGKRLFRGDLVKLHVASYILEWEGLEGLRDRGHQWRFSKDRQPRRGFKSIQMPRG